jgi:hypothetical protein
MSSEHEPHLSRKALIQSLILVAVVLAGLILFFAFGQEPRPLLESSLSGLR